MFHRVKEMETRYHERTHCAMRTARRWAWRRWASSRLSTRWAAVASARRRRQRTRGMSSSEETMTPPLLLPLLVPLGAAGMGSPAMVSRGYL